MYKVEIKEASRDLTPREKVMIKDTGNAVALDEATRISSVVINVWYYAILTIHNDKSNGDTDYEKIVIVDEAGNKFVTGSPTFMRSFYDIYADMQDDPELWAIEVYQKESKNYKGKSFISCSLV